MTVHLKVKSKMSDVQTMVSVFSSLLTSQKQKNLLFEQNLSYWYDNNN